MNGSSSIARFTVEASMPPIALDMFSSITRRPVSSRYRSARAIRLGASPPDRTTACTWAGVIPVDAANAARSPPNSRFGRLVTSWYSVSMSPATSAISSRCRKPGRLSVLPWKMVRSIRGRTSSRNCWTVSSCWAAQASR